MSWEKEGGGTESYGKFSKANEKGNRYSLGKGPMKADSRGPKTPGRRR